MLLRDLRDGQALAARLRSCLGDVSEMDLCSTLAMCDVRVCQLILGPPARHEAATTTDAPVSPAAIQLRARAPTRDAACQTDAAAAPPPPPCAGGAPAPPPPPPPPPPMPTPSRVAGRPGPQHALAMALSAELLAGGAAALRKGESVGPKRPAGAQEGGFAVSLDALRSVKLKSAAARPAAAPPAEPADSELITVMRAKLKRVKSPVMELELSSPPPASVGRAPLQQLAASTAARRPRPAQTPPTQPRLPSPGWGFLRIWRAPPPPVACAPLAEACVEKENTPHGGGAARRRPSSSKRAPLSAARPPARTPPLSNALASPLASPLSIRARSVPARRHDWLDVD